MDQQESTFEVRPSKKKWGWKRRVKYSLLFLLVVFVIFTTAIFHVFGPYEGKVVDLETGEPIEGAAVLILFYTEGGIVDTTTWYTDAVETVTDSNGEFSIPSQWIFTFHPFSYWDSHGRVKMFKPGYGVYPRYGDSEPTFEPYWTMPEKQYVTIKLPRLKSIAERKENIGYLYYSGAPDRKIRNMLRLESQERVNIGLSPLPSSRWGE